MSSFELSDKVESNTIFLINYSEIEKRLDPSYYIPSISDLEKALIKHNPKPLRDFFIKASSGATPKTTERDKYYSSVEEGGIPFLRVQNLSPTGVLQLDDCKYINEETHNGMLRRSQVSGGDLLVKITGVGRMAVASVAPENFIGNINQHIVVLKTESKEVSEIIAAYLNTDICEQLASRRATGGTRPALDYQALLSLPIIYDDRILGIFSHALIEKQKHDQKVEDLLATVDDYLLSEIGIVLPEKDDSLESRIFITSFSKVSGSRIDPFYFKNGSDSVKSTKFRELPLKQIAYVEKGQSITSADIVEGKYPVIAGGQSSPYSHNTYNYAGNVVTISASGAYAGFAWYHKSPIFASDCSVVQSKDEDVVKTEYLFNILKLKQIELYNLQQGSGQPHVYPNDINRIMIPVPDIEKQIEINNKIAQIKAEAEKLERAAYNIMRQAKEEVERLLLGSS